jgi:hypothetical protein
MVDTKSEAGKNSLMKKNPTTHFSSNILKTIIGTDKAILAFKSISTGALGTKQAEEDLKMDEFRLTQSLGLIGRSFLQENLLDQAVGKFHSKIGK